MAITPEDAAARPRADRRRLAIVAAAVVVLVVVLGALLLGGGDADEPASPPAAETATPAPVPADEDEDAGRGGGGGTVESFEVFGSRDPFEPLVTAGSEGGTGGGGGATIAPSVGGTSGATGGASATSQPPASVTPGARVGGHRVELVDVYRRRGASVAQVEVDSTVYTANEGERFAGSFKLVSAGGECATMLYGDDRFSLCEGEEILK